MKHKKQKAVKKNKLKNGGNLMSNKDFIKKFAQGATRGQYSNLRIDGDKLINYWTVIAERVEGGIRLNERKYSRSTSAIQSLIRNNCNVVDTFIGADIY